jgi:hypothetical protein
MDSHPSIAAPGSAGARRAKTMALSALNFALALLMLAFAVVQYNDPDWLLWVVYYLVPAFWALAAALRRRLFQRVQWLGWLWTCVAGWTALVVYYWPTMPGFWRKEVWWQEETAREGMGLMIALVVLLVALVTAYRKR